MKKLFRQLKINSFLGLCSAIFSYITISYLGIYLNELDFGKYNLFIAQTAILRTIIVVGADQCLVDFLLKIKHKNIATISILFNICLNSSFFFVCLIGYCYLIDSDTLFLFCFCAPIFYVPFLFESKQKVYLLNLSLVSERFLFLLIIIILNDRLNIKSLSISYLGVTLFTAYSQIVAQQLNLQKLKIKHLVFYIMRYYRNYWPVVIINICSLSYGQISKVYFANHQLWNQLNTVTIILQINYIWLLYQAQCEKMFRPLILNAINTKRRDDLKNLIQTYFKANIIPCVIFFAVVMFFRSVISTMFNKYHMGISDGLQVTVLLMPVIVSIKLLEIMLLGFGLQKYILKVYVLCSAMFLVVLFVSKLESVSNFFIVMQIIQISQFLLLYLKFREVAQI